MVAWVAVVLVQLANPDNGTWIHSLASVRPHAEWVPLFFFAYAVMKSKARIRNFLLLIVVLAAANGVVAQVQANLTPEQLADWGPGYEKAITGSGGTEGVSPRGFADSEGEAHNRPFGLGGDSGFGGIIGMIAIPAALALLALSQGIRFRILMVLLSVGTILAITSSASRTAVLGSVVAVFAFAALTVTSRAGLRTVIALGLALVIGYSTVGLLSKDSKQGSFARYESISNPSKAVSTAYKYRRDTLAKIPVYATSLPLGGGIGRNGPAASIGGGPGPGLDSESQPTFMLIELGMPGLIVILGFNLALFYYSLTRIRRIVDRELRILLTAVAAPLFAIFSIWFVGIATANVPTAPYLWFAGGVLSFWLVGDGYRSLGRPRPRRI